jgi:hypothetical protein
MKGYEEIKSGGQLIAIIVYNDFSAEHIQFFTPDSFPLQLAWMKRPEGETVRAHVHNLNKREITQTQEVIVIKHGKTQVDFYTDDHQLICSRILADGDTVLLASGGHGFETLEETEMLVIKQGPYESVEVDKTRF